MATGWNVMDALNNKTKAAAEDNKTKARFRTKDIAIKQMYSNDKNFYSIPDIEQLAQDILAVGLLENLTVVHDPCDRGEYRIIAGERRWRALTLLVEKGYEEFSVASCQIKTPAEEHEEMIQLIIANTYRNKTVADILEEQKTLEETLKYMKENQLQDVPVVLISANVNDENIHKAYSYEVADYIQKPFQEPVVKRRVESIIELFEKKKQMKAKGSP